MDWDSVQDFFDWLINELLVGELDWLEKVFLYPYSLFILGHIRVEYSPEATLEYFLSRRRDAETLGITSASAKLLEIGPTRNARFPVTVKYIFRDGKGDQVASSKACYLCLLDERSKLRIESVELTQVSMPFRDPRIIEN